MKRSDILYIIIDELCNHEPISRKNKNIESCAEWILKKIEENGMLPPTIVYAATGEYDLAKNFPGLDDYDCSFEWEPEE